MNRIVDFLRFLMAIHLFPLYISYSLPLQVLKTGMTRFKGLKLPFMIAQASTIEQLIRDYIEQRERAMVYGKKRLDAEKEYNRLLTNYNGEAKHYSLEQADKIFKAYQEMIANGEESSQARAHFEQTEEKLRDVGQILFEATITAEISMRPINGEAATTRSVRITYNNGQVVVN